MASENSSKTSRPGLYFMVIICLLTSCEVDDKVTEVRQQNYDLQGQVKYLIGEVEALKAKPGTTKP